MSESKEHVESPGQPIVPIEPIEPIVAGAATGAATDASTGTGAEIEIETSEAKSAGIVLEGRNGNETEPEPETEVSGTPSVVPASRAPETTTPEINPASATEGGREISNKILYVGSLHKSLSEESIKDVFSIGGPIHSIKLLNDKNKLGFNYAFIEFENSELAQSSLAQLQGTSLNDTEIKINWAYQSSSILGESADEPLFNIFVGDLSPEVDDESLNKAFSKFASLKLARVMWDMQTSRSRGYGFVNFTNQQDAELALQTMNGEWICGRAIRCNWASHKQMGQPQQNNNNNNNNNNRRFNNGRYNMNNGSNGHNGHHNTNNNNNNNNNTNNNKFNGAYKSFIGSPQLSQGDLQEQGQFQQLQQHQQQQYDLFHQHQQQIQQDHVQDQHFEPEYPQPGQPGVLPGLGKQEDNDFQGLQLQQQHHHQQQPISHQLPQQQGSPQVPMNGPVPSGPVFSNGVGVSYNNNNINNGRPMPVMSPQSYDIVLRQTPSWQTTVYLGNIAHFTEQGDLIPLLQNFGYIVDFKFHPERGCAFVKYDSHERAAMVIVQLAGFNVNGRPLKCGWGKDRPPMNHQYNNFRGIAPQMYQRQ